LNLNNYSSVLVKIADALFIFLRAELIKQHGPLQHYSAPGLHVVRPRLLLAANQASWPNLCREVGVFVAYTPLALEVGKEPIIL
jgi:hypothetical protein